MFELQCQIPDDTVQPLEDFLCEQVRSNWSIFNVRSGEPYFLMGYFADREALLESYAELSAVFEFLPESPSIVELDDKAWQDAYKDYIQPWNSRNLHWVPVWQRDDYVVPDGEHAVYLDAGMAFGTGSHETTRLMAMRLLDYHARCSAEALATRQVVDAGCGSGILAISAALLGFAHVYGFDRDPEAIRVSRENAQFNALSAERVTFLTAGLEAGLAGRQADLMLANIQADVLQIHVDGILQAMAPGSTLCLSGILVAELDKVRTLFAQQAQETFAQSVLVDSRVDGEWADVALFFE